MKKIPFLILFILINILISALTTLGILWIWDLTNPTSPDCSNQPVIKPVDNTEDSQSTESASSSDTLTNSQIDFVDDNFEIKIYAIVGPGNLDVEYVEIKNHSQGAIDLSNWQLLDENGNLFTFPALILNSEGAIKVLSKSGTNTVIELYWQSAQPIWQSGETASLLDSTGQLITTYSIP